MVRHGKQWALILIILGTVLGGLASQAQGGKDAVLLGEQDYWRMHVTLRPRSYGTAAKPEEEPRNADRYVGRLDEVLSPWPDAGWTDPDYDDAGWSRRPGDGLAGSQGYGYDVSANTALVCLRGRFMVDDPARAEGLSLALTFRGGAVVYLNGVEIARAFLPAGRITNATAAEDYPDNAFLAADGTPLPQVGGRLAPTADLLPRYQARLRQCTVALPTARLQAGVNVLAIELHRTAYPQEFAGGRPALWATTGLVSAQLTAPAATGLRPRAVPSGPYVWNADPLLRPGDSDVPAGDPCEALGPLRLQAPVNGLCSGQVVVSHLPAEAHLTATVSPLRNEAGVTIPASAMRVRYAKLDDAYIGLMDTPVVGAPHQPVWVTIRVPEDAAPGIYTGTLTLDGMNPPTVVPVVLTVYGWHAPAPREWKTWVNLLESPESVAGYYGVPLWSDEHFRLLEPSLRLMGECGNDVLGVNAIAKTVYGDDPLIVFRKEGDTYVPEFRFLERYLSLYDRVAGAPQMLAVQVWDYNVSSSGIGRDAGDKGRWLADGVSIQELQGDKLVPATLPMYGQPGTLELWRAVMEGIRARIQQLGWTQTKIVIGTGGDRWPNEEIVDMFRQAAPWATWRVITHGQGAPKWGMTDQQRTQPNHMVVGYLEIARRLMSFRDHVPGVPVVSSAGDHVGSNPFDFRGLAIQNDLRPFCEGYCWKGMDYWPFTGPDGARRTVLRFYVPFGNLVRATPRAITIPGPQGAVATVQYEMLREGTQDCEAIMYLDSVLKDTRLRDRLPAALVRRCEQVVEDYPNTLKSGTTIWPKAGDLLAQTARLYAAASEVTAILQR